MKNREYQFAWNELDDNNKENKKSNFLFINIFWLHYYDDWSKIWSLKHEK